MKTTDITGFSEYQRHLRKHLDAVRRTGRVLVVTNRGRSDAVTMSPERYEQLAEAEAILDGLKQVDQSASDVQAGRTHPARPGVARIADELGLDIEQ